MTSIQNEWRELANIKNCIPDGRKHYYCRVHKSPWPEGGPCTKARALRRDAFILAGKLADRIDLLEGSMKEANQLLHESQGYYEDGMVMKIRKAMTVLDEGLKGE